MAKSTGVVCVQKCSPHRRDFSPKASGTNEQDFTPILAKNLRQDFIGKFLKSTGSAVKPNKVQTTSSGASNRTHHSPGAPGHQQTRFTVSTGAKTTTAAHEPAGLSPRKTEVEHCASNDQEQSTAATTGTPRSKRRVAFAICTRLLDGFKPRWGTSDTCDRF